MKKQIIVCSLAFLLIFTNGILTAQTYASFPIDDEIYTVLDSSVLKGLCSPLPSVKPYTRKQIQTALEQIILSEKSTEAERKIAENQLARVTPPEEGFSLYRGSYFFKTEEKVKITMDAGFKMNTRISDGLYSDSSNSFAFDWIPTVYARGDFGEHLSYSIDVFGNATIAPLTKVGTYDPTALWSNTGKESINVYENRAFLPYSYTKIWDGSIYLISQLDAGGLKGWASDTLGLGFGINSEIDAAFLDDHIYIRAGRMYREWAGMDNGSSLLLNTSARPFLALESEISIFPWLRFSFLTGVLEFANNSYITENGDGSLTYQNAYSLDMVELNFKYFETQFGTSCIWPKRFEIGYAFPLFNKVFYQNNIGDYDNLNLFLNLKGKLPGIGSVWFSMFLDEVNGFSEVNGIFSGALFEYDRDMFALQGGAKVDLPFLPFASLSLRYTKIEPYCYTHQQLNTTPWYYGIYISENYTNNGYCLGYYLPPNSDEIRLSFDSMPLSTLKANVTYQFIRHGADYGTRAVDGSSLYSELNPAREEYRKYFLRDGCYQWYHIISTTESWSLSDFNVPVTLYSTIGFVYTWFTDTDSELGEKGTYHVINTQEYPTKCGLVMSLGFKIFY